MSESFATQPLQSIIPAYIYQQYSDDVNVQAFAQSFNTLAQSYLTWFNSTPLSVYISQSISGPLLDWIGQGIYGLERPTLSTLTTTRTAGFGTGVYGMPPAYGEQVYTSSGTAQIATDDVYKRVLTWHTYKGDGYQFSLLWLKNRVTRFRYGQDGNDFPVLDAPPVVKVIGSKYTIYVGNETLYLTDPSGNPIMTPDYPITYDGPVSSDSLVFQQAVANGVLALPFQYSFTVSIVGTLGQSGSVVTISSGYPTSATGLPAGSVWSNAGNVNVVPGITPNPTAPKLYFATTDALGLLGIGGGNLPLTAGTTGSGQIWNNGGVVTVS